MLKKSVIYFALIVSSIIFSHFAHAAPKTKGLYINQGTLENTKRLNYLIAESKAVGINTFVVDFEKETPNYRKNIQLIKDAGLHYVARIVVFPDGAKGASQLKSKEHLAKRLQLMERAINLGAEEIQLDYIRYSSKQPPSPKNAEDVKEIIATFKKEIAPYKIPLQIDIFGEVSFKESPRIGQNIQVFADTIDAACPMVYPSHYHPYQKHSKQPYQTVYNSLTALRKQFADEKTPFRLNPYIEASNYHYKMSHQQKAVYVMSQIRAVEDANADGWFIWSPKNHYDHVFDALKNRHTLADNAEKAAQPVKNAADEASKSVESMKDAAQNAVKAAEANEAAAQAIKAVRSNETAAKAIKAIQSNPIMNKPAKVIEDTDQSDHNNKLKMTP